jgi:predicted RND superfamily exporter protein
LIGLLTCFITAVFVLPALLEVLDGKQIVDKADKDDAEAQSD